jgi:ribosomal protein S18 acetylase RimI-like enzyme
MARPWLAFAEMTAVETEQPTRTVRQGTRDDVPQLAPMLARSFATCPAWQWYLPPETPRRLERMERFFGYLLERLYLGRDGRECVTTDDRAAVALWDSPEKWKLSARDNLGLLSTMLPVFRAGLPRAVRGFSALDSNHPREPHYYLSVLGVDPELRERGLAELVMQPVLERCDRERMPAYLETGRPRSRDFFARHGFEVTEEFDLPRGGPPVWRMWREPS